MKNKYIKNTVITVGIYISLLIFAYFVLDLLIAKGYSDYINQHTMFLDYIRKNFWTTGDLFPQWNMNYGLGQSFVIMFYYGMYNPFVLITYLMPSLNPVFAFNFIFAIVLGLNTLAMTKLLALNHIEGRLNSVVAVMSSFSGVFLFHISTHPMFIYYLPIMTLSLIALHYLVDENRKSYYGLTVGLIFFTNFTFAPMISVLQFFYFTALLVERKKFNLKSYVQFFISYVSGVLCGMMILLPTLLFMVFASSRTETIAPNVQLFAPISNMISAISSDHYVSGIFIIGIIGLLGTVFITRSRKYLIILIPMVLVLVFEPLNFAFNLFEYVHEKVYIMYLPLWWLMFAEVAKRGNKRNLGILTAISTLIFLIPVASKVSMIVIGIIICGGLVVYGLLITEKKWPTIAFSLILIASSLATNIRVYSSEYLYSYTNARGEVPREVSEYRELDEQNNHLPNIYSQVPNVYTSLENDYYIQSTRLEFEVPISSYVRQTKAYTFDNIYFQNLFGLKNEITSVNPIVYGVNDEDVYSLETYQQLDPNQKLYAVNQGLFVEGTDNESYQDKFTLQPVYVSNKSIEINQDVKKRYKLPKQYQNGVLNISFDSDVATNPRNSHAIEINGQVNKVMARDRYGINDNQQVTFRINTTDVEQLNLEVRATGKKPITYSNFKVTYQSVDNFEQNKLKVIEPTNFEVDLNDSYSFNLDMKKDGYLATTIPYDRGFKITVDGTEVPIEKMEDLFIGAKLTAGQHQIVITYHIPGFKIGLGLTILGWSIIGYFYISERKSKNN